MPMHFLRSKRTADPKLERIDCLLGVGTQVRGDLIFSGGLRIDGQVDGDVTVSCTDAGTLTIGDQGRVAGEVRVSHLVVYGCIEGPVHASGLVELRAGARHEVGSGRLVRSGEHHLRAFRRKPLHRARTDPRSPAGDQRDLAFKPFCHGTLPHCYAAWFGR